MKFKDLKEGKEYTSNIKDCSFLVYTKKEGLLYCVTDGYYSAHSFEEVHEADFEPYVEYHTLEEAVAWMKEGGFTLAPTDEKCFLGDEGEIHKDKGGTYCTLCMHIAYFQPKWVLLDKEE